jgi:hypothetical protein
MTKGAGTGLSGHFGLGERGDQATATLLQAAGDAALKDQPGLLNTFTRQDDTSALMGLSEGTATGAGRAARMLQEHWYKTSLQSDTEANLQSGMTQEAATAAAEISARASSARRTKSAFESARTLGINKVNAVAALTVMSQNKSRSIGTGEYEMIQGAISRLSGGNNQLAQDLAYNYQYNSRQAGREDLGGDWTGGAASRATTPEGKRRAVFMDAMSKTDTRTLLAGHPNTVKQAGEVIHGDLNGGDLETATKSAALLSELHANLASATDGNRDEVINILNGEGIRLDEPIEEQIAYKLTKIATNDGRTLTLPQAQAVLKNYSRNWGSSTPVQGREGEPPQQNPSPQV